MKMKKERLKPTDYFQWVTDFFNGRTSTTEKQIIERLRRDETHERMKDVYEEIDKQLTDQPGPPQKIKPERRAFPVMYSIVDAAVIYRKCQEEKLSRGKIRKVCQWKEIHKELNKTDINIVRTIRNLIELLNKHEKKEAEGFMISEVCLDIFHLIERAEAGNLLFDSHIMPIIEQTGSFDDRYYPTLQKVLETVILEFQEKKPKPLNSIFATVTISQKSSPADFIRFLHARIDQEKRCGALSQKFNLPYKTTVTITECVLGLKESKFAESHVSKALNRYKN